MNLSYKYVVLYKSINKMEGEIIFFLFALSTSAYKFMHHYLKPSLKKKQVQDYYYNGMKDLAAA